MAEPPPWVKSLARARTPRMASPMTRAGVHDSSGSRPNPFHASKSETYRLLWVDDHDGGSVLRWRMLEKPYVNEKSWMMARVSKEWFLGVLQVSVQIGGDVFVDVGQGCSKWVAAGAG